MCIDLCTSFGTVFSMYFGPWKNGTSVLLDVGKYTPNSRWEPLQSPPLCIPKPSRLPGKKRWRHQTPNPVKSSWRFFPETSSWGINSWKKFKPGWISWWMYNSYNQSISFLLTMRLAVWIAPLASVILITKEWMKFIYPAVNRGFGTKRSPTLKGIDLYLWHWIAR